MRPLRQTLELFLSREEPLAPAAPPGGRHSSFTAAAHTLGGPQALDAGSRTLTRYLSRRTRDTRGNAVPAGEVMGGDSGDPRTSRTRISFGSDTSHLVVRVLSAELSSSARLLRESRAGELRRKHELGWVPAVAAARQGAGVAAAFVRLTLHGNRAGRTCCVALEGLVRVSHDNACDQARAYALAGIAYHKEVSRLFDLRSLTTGSRMTEAAGHPRSKLAQPPGPALAHVQQRRSAHVQPHPAAAGPGGPNRGMI